MKLALLEDMSASEAVFGFAAWLTCRDETVQLGATEDASPVAELADKWCKTNKLLPPRSEIYPDNIVHPND